VSAERRWVWVFRNGCWGPVGSAPRSNTVPTRIWAYSPPVPCGTACLFSGAFDAIIYETIAGRFRWQLTRPVTMVGLPPDAELDPEDLEPANGEESLLTNAMRSAERALRAIMEADAVVLGASK
jgi:hypothetical protein